MKIRLYSETKKFLFYGVLKYNVDPTSILWDKNYREVVTCNRYHNFPRPVMLYYGGFFSGTACFSEVNK